MTAPMRDRLREALTVALKARDRDTANVLRATLAAIDNAEAVCVGPSGVRAGAIEHSPSGLAAADVARRELTEEQIAAIVRAEVAEREDAARGYEGNSAATPAAAAPAAPAAAAHAARLRAEAALLARFCAS